MRFKVSLRSLVASLCSGLTPHGVRHRLSGSMEEVGGAPTRFRTIQVSPKTVETSIGKLEVRQTD